MNDSTSQSRILTLVFTDLAGSTALKAQLGDQHVGELISRHRSLITALANASGGRVIDWAGDGCFLTFETSSAAVAFALHVQHAHAGEADLPRVRTGIHMGEISETFSAGHVDGPPRVEGLAVDLAARICGLARPGQILTSAAVADSARQRLDTRGFRQSVLWRAHGAYALKGFDEVLQVREVGLEGFAPMEAPSAGEKAMPSTPGGVTSWRSTGLLVLLASITIAATAAWFLWPRPAAPSAIGVIPEHSATPESKPLTVQDFDDRPAIAVLPFDNLSGDPEQEYFADSLAEDLITRLSLFRSFPVIARNSSFVFKGKAVDIKAVSADLDVRYVVEGSVRKSGSRIRIVAQLIDATTGEHVWAETYDRELTDVFVIQDEISSAIAASMMGDLQRAEQARVARSEPENLEAWALYQRALPLLYHVTHEDNIEARRLLERSMALDPQFAPARSKLAEALFWEVAVGWVDASQGTLDTALAEAQRAAAIDPRDPGAHIAQAMVLFVQEGKRQEALVEVKLAMELNPSDVLALSLAANHLVLAGGPPEGSLALVERAMRLSPHDPLEFIYYDSLFIASFCAGRFEESLTAARRLIALRPTYVWGYVYAAIGAAELGRPAEAAEALRQANIVNPGISFDFVHLGFGSMAPDVDRRVSAAMRKAGLE